MATGTVVFQSATIASPPATLSVMADAVNDSDHGAGTTQYVKIMDATTAGTAKASVTTANGLLVDASRIQGTVQALGSVQAVGTALTKEARASTYPLGTSIAGTVGNVILLAANTARMGASVYVEGGGALFLKMGSSAGTVDYSLQVPPGGYWECPFHYVGTISGIWQYTGGTARVTEYL